jgi:hypothetical protein
MPGTWHFSFFHFFLFWFCFVSQRWPISISALKLTNQTKTSVGLQSDLIQLYNKKFMSFLKVLKANSRVGKNADFC